ncbi:MAG: InlB B-repeat-containing protein, partial [Muribaculaceae bacterium]|nr:InlB B-repeat-containing protein [Muribaculaceae bacterium]
YSIVFKLATAFFYSAQIPYQSEISVPEVPEREGYTFSGWGDVPAVMPATDLEFSGTFNVNSYKVTFSIGEEIVLEYDLAFGESITLPEVPEKEGYTFSGWGIVPSTMPASDLEFNGVYEVNLYNVIFMIDDDVVYSTQLPYGSEIVAPQVPEKEGYTFSGWSEYPKTVPANDVKVTATFDVNLYRLIVYINDDIYMDEELEYGADIEISDPVFDNGMVFIGWNEEIPATMPAHDLIIHGVATNPSSVGAFVEGEQSVTVISPDGIVILMNADPSEIRDLTPGLYIINGKKKMIREVK